ncbi:hypothetical protein FBU30_007230 [Linnemannia zychae]|nr:hypothetical protein FBU30_007230 [Linnemannia zychae]
MPNLLSVRESGCKGIDEQDWMSSLWLLKRLARAYSSRQIWYEDEEINTMTYHYHRIEELDVIENENEYSQNEEIIASSDRNCVGGPREWSWQQVFYGTGRVAAPESSTYNTRFWFEQLQWRPRFKLTTNAVRAVIGQRLRRELVFALVNAGAEHLQSVDIPISDISAYLPLVSRLKSLFNIRFLLDKEILLNCGWPLTLTSEEKFILKVREESRIQDLETMISFVQEHRRLHPKVLNTTLCKSVYSLYEKCPEEFHTRLIQSLPPLRRPKVLDKSNWLQFVTHFQDTDLSQLKTISLLSLAPASLQQFKELNPFLQHCRSLHDFKIYSWSEDLFQWAVDEQMYYTDAVNKGRVPKQEPISLKRIEIYYT